MRQAISLYVESGQTLSTLLDIALLAQRGFTIDIQKVEKKVTSRDNGNTTAYQMDYFTFTSLIETQIQNLSHTRRIDLAISICNRLLPEYETFSKNHNWGDPKLLKEGIDFCTFNKGQDHFDFPSLDKLKTGINLIIPDTGDFGDWDGSYALNASAAVAETLDYLVDRQPKHIIDIVTFWTGTVDFKIQEKEGKYSLEQMDKHPLMLSERLQLLDITK